MNYMNGPYPYQGRARSYRRMRKGGWLAAFAFCLIFLAAGCLPALISLPRVMARFTGVETHARVSVLPGDDCGDDEDGPGNYYTYTFTDIHGQVQEITDNSTCSSGIVSDGDIVTIWYNPNNPVVFISANDLWFDSIFLVGFSLPLPICLILFLVVLFKRRRAAQSQEYRYTNYY